MQTALAEMDHKQPPTPVATDNTAADSIVNGMAKKKIHSNRHEILLGTRQNMKKHSTYSGMRERKTWQIISQNTTQYGTTEL